MIQANGIDRARRALEVCEEMEQEMHGDYDLAERFRRAGNVCRKILTKREQEAWRALQPPEPEDEVIVSWRAVGVELGNVRRR